MGCCSALPPELTRKSHGSELLTGDGPWEETGARDSSSLNHCHLTTSDLINRTKYMVPRTVPGGSCPVQSQRFIKVGRKHTHLSSVDEGHKSLADLSGKISYKPEWALPPGGAQEALGLETGSTASRPLTAPLKPAAAAGVTSETIQPTGERWATPALNAKKQQLSVRYHCHRL